MFSARELEILKILGKKKMTIIEITKKYYGCLPPNGNNGIGATVRMINYKCAYHDLDWCIVGKGGGRAGTTVWKEKLWS